MGLSLRNIGRKLTDFIGGTNAEAGRRSIEAANRQLQTARYGVLARPQQQQRFVSSQVRGNTYNPITTGGRVLADNFVGGVTRFGQPVADTILSPVTSRIAQQQSDYANRVLGRAYGTNPVTGAINPLGQNAAEVEAGRIKQGFLTDPLNRANIGVADSTATVARKVLAKGAEAGLDIATLGAGTAVKAGFKPVIKAAAKSGTLSAGSGLSNLAQRDDVTMGDVAKTVALAGGLGAALPATVGIAKAGANKAIPTVAADFDPKAKPKVALKVETTSSPQAQTPLSVTQTPAQTAVTGLSPPTSGKPKVSSRAASVVNTERYNVSDEARQGLQSTLDELQPEVQAKVGKKLSLKETQEYADVTNRVLSTSKTRQQTIAANAAMQKARERQAMLEQKIANKEVLTPREQAELVRVSTAVATAKADLGRSLGALRMDAGPKEKTMVGLIMEKLAKEVNDAKAVAEAAKKYDFNDPKQLADFYRQFIKATPEDWLDKYRYTNMLSSPLTQVRNVSSNVMGGSVVAPVQKLYEGAVDALSPGARTRFAGEAGEYTKGFWGSLDEAKKAFGDVMTNKSAIQNPDLDSLHMMPLATSGVKGKLDTVLSTATKLMEAFDQAGQALVRGGETRALNYRAGKGVAVGNIPQSAQKKATYTLFRDQLGGKEQGHVLQAIDAIPQAVAKWRQSSNPVIRNVSKFTFPFIKTPVNISKQMMEYSPLGMSTVFGAADKKAQIAKALMGTTAIGTAAGVFAANDAITFSEPDSTKEKNDFKASGKQPYSIKIGDKWISYRYLHPGISFNLAAVASVKKALDEKKIDDRMADTLLKGFAGSSRFFVDQSYFKNAQDFMTNISGESLRRPASTLANQAANTASQLVPFRAMQTWINNMIDQTQRKTDYKADVGTQFLQNIARQLPVLSQTVPARLDSQGNPVAKPHPMINAFSPASVTTDKTGGPAYGPEAQKTLKSGTTKEGYSLTQRDDGKYEVKIDDKTITKDDLGEARDEIAKDSLKKSGDNIRVIGEKVYRKSKDGKVTPMRKLDYDYSVGQNKLQSAKKKDDFNGWLKQADVQLQNLETQLQDPTLDELDKSNIQEKIDNLLAEGEKYLSYGGFKKGKTGSGSRGRSGRGGGGGGGGSSGPESAGSIYKYAVDLQAGGAAAKPKVSVKGGTKTATVKKSTGKPTVAIKRARA